MGYRQFPALEAKQIKMTQPFCCCCCCCCDCYFYNIVAI